MDEKTALAIQQEYLTAIADAIKQKEGSDDPIFANEFAERILALKSGGGASGGGGLILKGLTAVTIPKAIQVLDGENT